MLDVHSESTIPKQELGNLEPSIYIRQEPKGGSLGPRNLAASSGTVTSSGDEVGRGMSIRIWPRLPSGLMLALSMTLRHGAIIGPSYLKSYLLIHSLFSFLVALGWKYGILMFSILSESSNFPFEHAGRTGASTGTGKQWKWPEFNNTVLTSVGFVSTISFCVRHGIIGFLFTEGCDPLLHKRAKSHPSALKKNYEIKELGVRP